MYFLKILRPPRSKHLYSSAASYVYKRQDTATSYYNRGSVYYNQGEYNKDVSYTNLRSHETKANLECSLLLEKKKIK